MRNKITMEMSIFQAENGFSLDELVKKNWQMPLQTKLVVWNGTNYILR
ncbi:MAG: hypothetical protein J6W00_03270 [Lentisphaeria bacterium]|nr:hypothetical protein [Lentisphaeria bacterium]